MIFFTARFIKKPHHATTYGPFIFIDPACKHDKGLLEHEKVHVDQWWRTMGIHSLMYRFSKSYRLDAEVEAYRRQLMYAFGQERRFAHFIATRYGLKITEAEALNELHG